MSYATQVAGEWLTRVSVLREAPQGHTGPPKARSHSLGRPHKGTQVLLKLTKTTQEGGQVNTKWEIACTIQFSSTLEIV